MSSQAADSQHGSKGDSPSTKSAPSTLCSGQSSQQNQNAQPSQPLPTMFRSWDVEDIEAHWNQRSQIAQGPEHSDSGNLSLDQIEILDSINRYDKLERERDNAETRSTSPSGQQDKKRILSETSPEPSEEKSYALATENRTTSKYFEEKTARK